MKVFDFNIHLPTIVHSDVNVVIESDLHLELDDIKLGFKTNAHLLNELDYYNVLLFNTDFFNRGVVNVHKLWEGNANYTALIDFRRFDLLEYLEKVKASGVKAIMFNSYLQRISKGDFISVLRACQFAEENGLIICLDGSFGTSKMYVFDNLKLACFISDFISKSPIVIVHSGGRRILDFMLLADEKKNVWFDTSFSLPFYVGSSLEMDFSYAYRKVGLHRVVFGSDIPYVDFNQVKKIHIEFFEKYKFTSAQIDDIFCFNALRLFS